MKEINNRWIVYLHVIPKQINGHNFDKYYVGITRYTLNIRSRKDGSGYKSQSYFYRAIQKYGWDNIRHIILKTDLTKDEAEFWETEYIRIYDSHNSKFGYNLTTGGEGLHGYIMSQETREKYNEVKKGEKNSFYGKKHTPETKALIKAHHADLSGINNPKHKAIYSFTLDGIFIKKYETITQAEMIDGFAHQTICHCASGKQKTGYKRLWRYEQDVIYSEANQTYYIIRNPYNKKKGA